jgi:UDP-N-acetylglucosamine 2-epimerase (non-hydrolysing)
MLKILNVAGARPNFMKIAPLVHEMNRRSDITHKLVHTGQHYDVMMSKVFFDELDIPAPDVNLEVGAGERSMQIDRIMTRFDPIICAERPDVVVVVGDVNSTVACARIARSHGVKVAHVEAGLRSFDPTMPEELNRVETDQLSDLMFVTEPSAIANIANEGLTGRAYLVGNVMIDTLVKHLPHARTLKAHGRFGLEPRGYVVATFHRPSNVDDPVALRHLIDIIRFTCARLPMVLALHPRTRGSLTRFGLLSCLEQTADLHLTEPLGYLDFLSLVATARAVITDSGGIQEETTYLRVPCITMRDNTERPITVELGSNVLAGTATPGVKACIDAVLAERVPASVVPGLWDGCAAHRIVSHLREELGG